MNKRDSVGSLKEEEQGAENALPERMSEKKRTSGLPASSERGGVKTNRRPKTVSSDYDDDGFFDDFPSRSVLMGKVGSRVVKSNAHAQERNETAGSRVETGEMKDVRSTAKATAPRVGTAMLTSPDKQNKPPKRQGDLDFFAMWDDLTSEPEISKDPDETKASKDAMALIPSEANGSRNHKRKASKMDGVQGQLFQHEKRVKPAPSMDAMTQIEHKAMKVSAEWEDIDPLLMDEFKDIVNFF